MKLFVALLALTWPLALAALFVAVIVGLAYRSWVAAAIAWTATFALLNGGLAALLRAIKREQDREARES